MGALLVTLLQCRNNQTLYPNLCATQSRLVTHQQPCSVPLPLPSPPQTQQPPQQVHTAVGGRHTAADGTTSSEECEEVGRGAPQPRVSPDSSALDGSPGFYKPHPPLPEAPHGAAHCNTATKEEKKAGSPVDEAETVDAVVRQQQQQERQQRERLRFGLTCQRHTSTDSDESKTASNAIYRYTLPGARAAAPATAGTTTPATAAPASALTSAGVRSPAETWGAARLPLSATPPSYSDAQSTQPGGGNTASMLEQTRRRLPQHKTHTPRHTSVPAAAAVRGDGSLTPLSLTPLRAPAPTRDESVGETRGAGPLVAPLGSLDEPRNAGTGGMREDRLSGGLAQNRLACTNSDVQQQQQQQQQQQRERGAAPSFLDAAAEAEAELGPMDCADAFQYFYEGEEAYRMVESVTYVAPPRARATSPQATRDFYLHQRTALGPAEGPSSQAQGIVPAAPSMDVLGGIRGSSGSAAPRFGKSTPPPILLDAPQGIHLVNTNAIYTNATAPAAASFFATAAADTPCGAEGLETPPHDAGRFVSLVEEMFVACRRVGTAAFVCWRSTDRVAPLQEAPRRLFGGEPSTAALFARGEVEDDVSHVPAAAQRDDDDSSSSGGGVGAATAAASLYYLGPQQYLTAVVWWSRVEAFSFGLRSIGLRPGDFIGIVEDTRWEWLVTCYAAWNTGLVVVVCAADDRTLRRVAVDTYGDMKAVVCDPQVHHVVRRHFTAAAAERAAESHHGTPAIAAIATTAAATAGMRSTSNSSRSGRSTADDVTAVVEEEEWSMGGRGDGGSVNNTAAASARARSPSQHQQHQQQQQQGQEEPSAVPLFIIVRSTVPTHDSAAAAPRVSETTSQTARGGAASQKWPPRRSSPTSRRPAPHTTRHRNDEVEEDEEEEALWWTDVLTHGEAKLAAWRQRQARERRQQQRQQQQQQVRLRLQQQQRQRWTRDDPFAVAADGAAGVACRRRHSSQSNAAASGVGSRVESAVSTSLTAPTLGWAATTTACTTASADFASTAGVSTMTASHSGNAEGPLQVSAGDRSAPTATAVSQRGPASLSPVPALLNDTPSSNTAAAATQLPLAPLRPDDLAMIFYTAGEPKGVLLTHGALKASMAAHQEYFNGTDIGFDDGLRRGGVSNVNSGNNASGGGSGAAAAATTTTTATSADATAGGESRLARYYHHAATRMPALRSRTAPAGRPTYLAYLPLHHISELMAQITLLVRGVLVCYGTRRTLFDAFVRPHGDLTEYKPTIFAALPATLARLHRAVQSMLSTGYRKLLFDVAYEARRQALRRGLQSPFLLSTIFAQPRELLGGRCRLVLCREAPLHPRDQEYLQVVCGVSVVQQFGPVEAAGCGLQQAYCGFSLDTVGGPLGPLRVKLRDVAGGWTHQGERPTGELLLAGPTIMAGYYRQPERTAEVLERGGWLHAQVVAERCPDGGFRLVASLRPHHALTSNGQLLDLEWLEAHYARHPLCQPGGFCLLVHPYRRYACGLVLSSERRVRAFVQAEVPALAGACDAPGWWPRCLRDPQLHTAAAHALATWAAHNGETEEGRAAGLTPVRHVRVLHDVWDVARRTRTATGRLLRYGIHCRYGAVIHELFAEPD